MYLYVNKRHSKSKDRLIDELEDIQMAIYSINMSLIKPVSQIKSEDSEKFLDEIIPDKLKILEKRKKYLESKVNKPFAIIKESY